MFDKYLARMAFGSALLFIILITPNLVVKISGIEASYRLAERADHDYRGVVGEIENGVRESMRRNPEAWIIKTETRPREIAVEAVERAWKLRAENQWLAPFYRVGVIWGSIGAYIAGLTMMGFAIREFRDAYLQDRR